MRKVRVWFSLWRHALPTTLNLLVSIGCYAIGWWLSSASDPGPLIHAGALATATAVATTLYDYRSRLAGSEQAAVATVERLTAPLKLTGAASLASIKVKARRNTTFANRMIAIGQASLLIVATLVWGFADLAPKWIPGAFR